MQRSLVNSLFRDVLVLSALVLSTGANGQDVKRFQVASNAPNAGATPQGLSSSDWSSIRAAYEAGKHAAYAVDGGYQARNARQAWLTHFDGRGFTTTPGAGGWQWGLQLESYGFTGSERMVKGTPGVKAEGGRVSYEWDANVTEWFVNDTRGLEHGYTILNRPEGSGRLSLTLSVRGNLTPQVSKDGRGVRFTSAGKNGTVDYSGLTVTDADGRVLAATLEQSDKGLRLSLDERGARYPLTIDPLAQNITQQAYLKASNTDGFNHVTGAGGDLFGTSVAVSGNTVVVGAHHECSSSTGVNGDQSDNTATYAGAAYVFVQDSCGGWTQEAYLKASNTDAKDQFGYCVSVSGDTIVIGAPTEDSSASGVNGNQSDNSLPEVGSAYVFVRSGGVWSQQAYLKASNPGISDRFGHSVAVSGDTIVVGSYCEDSTAIGVNSLGSDPHSNFDSGAAYVFVRSGTTWTQQAYLKASNTGGQSNTLPYTYDGNFGFAVAISGDTIVVGSPNEASDGTGVNGNQHNKTAEFSGAAYIFVQNGTTWTQEAYLKASNAQGGSYGAGDYFGGSVAISGNTVVVGAPSEDSDATSVDGDQTNNSATSAGAAYVFIRNGATWSQQAYLKASTNAQYLEFGHSVAVDGNRILVGRIGQTGQGAVVFSRSAGVWSEEAFLVGSNTEQQDYFGCAVAVSGDTLVVGAYGEHSGATGVNGNQLDNSAQFAGAAYAFDLGVKSPVNPGAMPSVVKVATTAGSSFVTLGVVADPRWVVVSAYDIDMADGVADHAVNPTLLVVDDGSFSIPVASVRFLPTYTPPHANDLALLELGNPTSLAPAALAKPSYGNFTGQGGTSVWRNPCTDPCLSLMQTDLTILSNAATSNYWGAASIHDGNLGAVESTQTLAPGCGPVFVNYQGAPVLAGVFSWQDPAASASLPTVYTRVSFYYSWIAAEMVKPLTPGSYVNTASGCGSTSCQPSWMPTVQSPATLYSLATFNDGNSSALYLGTFGSGVMKWDGSSLTALSGMTGVVKTLTVIDGTLYTGGWGGAAQWDPGSQSFTAMGALQNVNALAGFGNGPGATIFAGTGYAGNNAGVQQWSGAWTSLGTWSHGDVNALTVFNGELYAAAWGSGGWGGTGQDGVIARWNGASQAWDVLGTWSGGSVHAFAVFNGELYAGGYFPSAGGVGADPIAKWSASSQTWTPMGGLTDSTVHALAVHDDGSGQALYAAGEFNVMGGVAGTVFGFPAVTGGVTASKIAKWNGSTWSALGSGIDQNGQAFALATYNDGSGSALFAAGEFLTAGGSPANFLAKWGCTSSPPAQAFGTGTPGLAGVHTLGMNLAPRVNTSAFALSCNNAPPSSLGLGIVTDAADAAGSDPFGIGVLLHVSFFSASEVYAFDFVSNALGNALTVGTAIPNSPALIGKSYHAQALWAWPLAMGSLPPNNLSTSKGLTFTILAH